MAGFVFTINEANARATTGVKTGWCKPNPTRAGSAGRTGTADVTTQRHRQGFTLIELMVALAIAALLLLLGMPSFTTFVRNSEIRSTSESIINGLRAATTEAANRNRPVTFSLKGSGADWTGLGNHVRGRRRQNRRRSSSTSRRKRERTRR